MLFTVLRPYQSCNDAGLIPATLQLITSYTDQLLKDGLVTRILAQLDSINLSDELVNLERGRAIGDPRHRRQIVEMIEEQRMCLVDCLFLWAVQTPFGKDETLEIIHYIRNISVNSTASDDKGDSGGQSSTVESAVQPVVGKVTVDMVTVSLCMTVLACFNIGEDAVNQSDDSLLSDHYPLLSDATFLPAVHTDLNEVKY